MASTILGIIILMYEAYHSGSRWNEFEYTVQNPSITILVTFFGSSLKRISSKQTYFAEVTMSIGVGEGIELSATACTLLNKKKLGVSTYIATLLNLPQKSILRELV